MKKILFIILIAIPLLVSAQTQQGYVKTKGRLGSNGTVVAGQRLSGATVTVRGGNAVVSGSKGDFTLVVPSGNFYLQNVQKQGYVLTDPDVLSKQYAYSKNPLVLVLETPSQQADDKLAAERKIRRTLQRQLQEKEDEIETLKEQQKLTDEEYRKQLQEIFARQEAGEKFISEMADRYSKIDFDEVDEFNRQISSLILEGKLIEADSLINTKGDINSRAEALRQHQKANAQAEQELLKKQKTLEKSKDLAQKELEELAQDCFSKYEIFKMQHLNDSAAYYIELRAELDTQNSVWQDEAGAFFLHYMANYDKALALFLRAQCAVIQEMGEGHAPKSFNNIAWVYHDKGNYEQALEYFKKNLDYWLQRKDNVNYDMISQAFYGIGCSYNGLADYLHAIENLKEALSCCERVENKDYVFLSTIQNVLGVTYNELADYPQANKYLTEAEESLTQADGEEEESLAVVYKNHGITYKKQGDYDQAIAYYKKAHALDVKHYGEMHPESIKFYGLLGSLYMEKGDYPQSLEWSQKALAMMKVVLGPSHPNLLSCYFNIAGAYGRAEDYQNALTTYLQTEELLKQTLGEEHPYMWMIMSGMGTCHLKLGNPEKGYEMIKRADEIVIKTYGEKYPFRSEILKYKKEAEEKLGIK